MRADVVVEVGAAPVAHGADPAGATDHQSSQQPVLLPEAAGAEAGVSGGGARDSLKEIGVDDGRNWGPDPLLLGPETGARPPLPLPVGDRLSPVVEQAPSVGGVAQQLGKLGSGPHRPPPG